MADLMCSLRSIANPESSRTNDPLSPLLDKCAPAIKAIQQNKNFMASELGDVILLLTQNHEIGSLYLAINSSEEHMCYLEKALEFHHHNK